MERCRNCEGTTRLHCDLVRRFVYTAMAQTVELGGTSTQVEERLADILAAGAVQLDGISCQLSPGEKIHQLGQLLA